MPFSRRGINDMPTMASGASAPRCETSGALREKSEMLLCALCARRHPLRDTIIRSAPCQCAKPPQTMSWGPSINCRYRPPRALSECACRHHRCDCRPPRPRHCPSSPRLPCSCAARPTADCKRGAQRAPYVQPLAWQRQTHTCFRFRQYPKQTCFTRRGTAR